MDEHHRSRPLVESFMLVLCMICPGVSLAALLNVDASSFLGSLVRQFPLLWISLLVMLLAGCCWFAGWILESSVEESRRLGDSVDTGLLLLVFQLLFAPVVAFLASFPFRQMF